MDTLGWKIGDRFVAPTRYKEGVFTVSGFYPNHDGKLCLKCDCPTGGLWVGYCQKLGRDENVIEPQEFN